VPVLSLITPPEANPAFTVSWSTAAHADSYVLERATNPDFGNATQVYAGSETFHTETSQGIATYHYRVKARNTWNDSEWSSSQSVEVRWEQEPNDAYDQANGPLTSGKTYYGYQDNAKDYFYLDMPTSGKIIVDLFQYSGQGVQLQLFRGVPSVGTRVAWRAAPPYHLEYNGEAGRYYVYIFTESGGSSSEPYYLTVQFP
jgi:hypothetical protein